MTSSSQNVNDDDHVDDNVDDDAAVDDDDDDPDDRLMMMIQMMTFCVDYSQTITNLQYGLSGDMNIWIQTKIIIILKKKERNLIFTQT